MSIFVSILVSTGFIALISLSGALFLFFKKGLVQRISIFLLAFAAGALMGNAFLHLLPRAIEKVVSPHAFLFVLFGFGLFFFIENSLHWNHTRGDKPEHRSFGILSLLGDGAHNFLDGMIIASVFFIDVKLGFATTLAIALHEIPQEIGDFGILIYAGYTRSKALLFNFISALAAVVGALVTLAIGNSVESFIPPLVAISAGSFIYIAGSDLVPELQKTTDIKKSLLQFIAIVIGVSLMFILTLI